MPWDSWWQAGAGLIATTKVAGLGGIIFLPLVRARVLSGSLDAAASTGSRFCSFAKFGVALVAVLWVYEAWHTVSFAAGEMKNPQRDLPRGFLIGSAIVILIYMVANIGSGWFRLDDGGALSVFRKSADNYHLFQTGGLLRVSSGGVGGTLPTHDFLNQPLTLAGTTFTNVPVSVSDTRVGAFASRSIAGNLGAGILSRFRITFDYRAHTLTFLPNPNAGAPFGSDRTGLSLTQDDEREITVLGVMAGSPAEKAGVLAGEAIVGVNNVSVSDQRVGVYDLDPLRYGLDPFELTVRRGQMLTITITPGDW